MGTIDIPDQPAAGTPGSAGPGALASPLTAAEKAEAASAGLFVQALAKAERGFSMYLPNNPQHEKFFTEFCQRAAEHLEEYGAVRLDITHESILCCGETVYTNPEIRENLAFRMYVDGIRSLRLDDGIEPSELRTLVEIIGRPSAEDDEDDIVTDLWSSDLPHVSYVLAEVPPEGGVATLGAGLVGSRAAHEGALRRYSAELSAAQPAPLSPPPSYQIFLLSEQEVAALQGLLARDAQRAPLEDMVGILEPVIAAEFEGEVLDEFLEVVARLCGNLLLAGRVDQAVELLSMVTRIASRPGLPASHAAKVAGVRARVVTAEVLAGLSKRLAKGPGIERELLRSLVAGLGTAAIEPFCHILGDVSGKETRKALIEALVEAGRGTPELFLPFLRDSRWYLVRNAVYILRRMAGPESARAVVRCADHQDPRVRKEVLLYFEATGEAAGEAVMLAFLGDEVSSLRVSAVRNLARRGSRAAVERLLALTASASFAERARPEREAVWEALGTLAPERVLPLLRQMVLRRHWFGQAKDLDDTACACAGLKRIGTAEALEVLQKAAARKRGEQRELVELALRSLTLVRGQASRPGTEPNEDAEA